MICRNFLLSNLFIIIGPVLSFAVSVVKAGLALDMLNITILHLQISWNIFEPEINARFEIEWILLFMRTKAWIESGRLSGNSVKLLLWSRRCTKGSWDDRRFPSILWIPFPCSSRTVFRIRILKLRGAIRKPLNKKKN